MSQLEIIHLRSSGTTLASLNQWIRESMKAQDENAEVVTLYRRDGLETDVAIHIHHLVSHGDDWPSTIGLRLAAALRTYGLVEHSLWEELE